MNLKSLFTRFKNDEDGAVTVDWVVLAAACVGLAAIIGTTVKTGVDNATADIVAQLPGGTTGTAGTGTDATTP